jgi:Carbamoyl-phosphate synthase L chain, ATP binding domain
LTILILNRGPLALRPYHEWFADHPGPLLLLASRADLVRLGESLPTAADGYLHAESLADYEDCDALVARGLELAREHRIEHVIACQERDLEPAGILRDRLGLPGQGHDSALAFRDKVVMKRYAMEAGIPVAPHAPVDTVADVREFARAHGFPVVIKQRDGFSSVGMTFVHSQAELDDFLAARLAAAGPDALVAPGEPELLAEAFVEGTMYHVDGIVVDGDVVVASPSCYQYQLASFAHDESPRLDLALDADDPLGQRLIAFTERLLAGLPTPENTTFHAEIFHTGQDGLVLCEIASRNGGALIKSVLEAMFGVNLPTAWPRASVGLPVPLPRGAGRMRPRGTAGQLLLLRRAGAVRQVPGQPPFDWIERYECYIKPGQVSAGARSSGDFMVAMVASAPDRHTCEQRLRQAAEWFEDGLVIEPAAEPVPA